MKKRQTMGKMMRDRELRERRAMKQQKKDDRKLQAENGEAPAAGEEDLTGPETAAGEDAPGAAPAPLGEAAVLPDGPAAAEA
jgi:hypothetical protein